MNVRPAIASLLFFAVTAVAQNPTPQAPVAAPPATPAVPAGQDPDMRTQSPEAEVEALKKEKARLQREIEYAKARSDVKSMLKSKFGSDGPTWRTIDAGTAAAPVAAAPVRNVPIAARVAIDGDMEALGSDGMLLVNTSPVRREVFEATMSYLRTLPTSGDDTQRAQRVLMDLIRTEAACVAFADSDARANAADIQHQLREGKPPAEVAKKYRTVPGASPEGRLEITRNSVYGPVIERIAFATKVGEVSEPIRTSLGVVVLKVAAFEKGASNELDKLQVDALLAPLTDDELALNKVLESVQMGQVQIVARDEATLQLLPAIFRPRAGAGVGAPIVDMATLQRTLEQLTAEMSKLQAATDEASKKKLQQLQQQYEATKTALKQMEATSTSPLKPVEVKPGETKPLDGKPDGKGEVKPQPKPDQPK